MALTERRGWLGGLKQVLSRVETTHQPHPDPDSKVVDIPHGLERLRKAIMALQSDLVEAQAERADYIQAWSDCQQEINAHLSKNTTRQRDLAHRLDRLQTEWVKVTQDLGIRAESVPSALNLSTPDSLGPVITIGEPE